MLGTERRAPWIPLTGGGYISLEGLRLVAPNVGTGVGCVLSFHQDARVFASPLAAGDIKYIINVYTGNSDFIEGMAPEEQNDDSGTDDDVPPAQRGGGFSVVRPNESVVAVNEQEPEELGGEEVVLVEGAEL